MHEHPPQGHHVATLSGVSLRVHWSILLSFALMGGGFSNSISGYFGVMVVIVAHEFGHVVLLRWYGIEPLAIVLHGLGGECLYQPHTTPWQDSVIAWGGVLAQATLLAVALGIEATGLWAKTELGRGLVIALIAFNPLVALVNLLPVGHLDGVRAWRVFPLLYQRFRHAHLRAKLRSLEAEAAAMDAARALDDDEIAAVSKPASTGDDGESRVLH